MATDSSDIPSDVIPSTTNSEVRKLSPEDYVYTTPSDVEKFADVPYNPANLPKNDLSPPSSKEIELDKISRYCSKEVNKGKSICQNPKKFCQQYPNHDLCHEEDNPYQELGFFTDTNPNIFIPELRNPVRKDVQKPVNNIYENKLDDIQFDAPNVRITKCKCKDGSVAQGYINMRNGQKDCSNCQNQRKSYPSVYKNYKTTPKVYKPRTDIKQPLRKQVGVSHFGDVNMKGCSVSTQMSRNNVAENTLNRVVNTSNNAPIGSIITQQNTSACVPDGYSIYENCPTDIYGV